MGATLESGQNETSAPGGPDLNLSPERELTCPSSSPVVKQLALNLYSSYALLSDGSLWCWGRCWPHNSDSVEMAETTPRPVRVALDGVARVAAGDYGACAALEDGTVQCWGRNLFGEAGPQTAFWTIKKPSQIAIQDVIDLSAGHVQTCALRRDGTVACWGLPYVFFPMQSPLPVGVSPDGPQPDPVEIPGIEPDGQEIRGGHYPQCLRRATGQLRCFSGNPVPDLSNETVPIRAFGASSLHVCLADIAGEARCYLWGEYIPWDPPVAVPAWKGAFEIAIEHRGGHACALVGGQVRCAGPDDGKGFIDTVDPRESVPVPGLSHSTHVAVGPFHGCALDSGCVRCWGRNNEGQLGDGTYRSSSAPTVVTWE